MQVRELNQEQLDELKVKVFYLDIEDEDEFFQYQESWNDDIQVEWEKAQFPYDISNETIYKLFEGIDFVDEDFVSSSLPTKLELNIDSGIYDNDYELENIINDKLSDITGYLVYTYDYEVKGDLVIISNIVWDFSE